MIPHEGRYTKSLTRTSQNSNRHQKYSRNFHNQEEPKET